MLVRSPDKLNRVTDTVRVAVAGARGVTRSGLLHPQAPTVALRLAGDLRRWGTSPALGFAPGVSRHPDATAVIDADDAARQFVSFAEMDHRCNVLATSLLDRGVGPGIAVGLLGRNSRSFIETIVAVSRTGADLVYLNTGSTAEQIEHVAAGERIGLIVRDREFAGLVPAGLSTLATDDPAGIPLLASLPTRERLSAPRKPGQHIILTSGTTGRPRGAARSETPVDAIAAVLDAFPIRVRGTTVFAAPLFHAWGWLHFRLATMLDSTQVVVRRPDPVRLLELLAEHQADTLIAVPVILRRLLDVPPSVRNGLDLSHLRCVAVSGSHVPEDVTTRFMDAYGDVLFNLYGTTEAAYATCAKPADLRADPATAGHPLPGVRVEIFDQRGRAVATGVDGRVHVGSRTSFSGYTDGSDRERIHGLVFTGDLGRLDAEGRLTIVGRADDVVVTGGENVHPAEVEEILRKHPSVADIAVTGSPDPVYGSILVAHVVLVPGAPQDGAALIEWSRTRLGPHHRPRRVVFHDDLPRNATGKVVRRALAGENLLPDPDEG